MDSGLNLEETQLFRLAETLMKSTSLERLDMKILRTIGFTAALLSTQTANAELVVFSDDFMAPDETPINGYNGWSSTTDGPLSAAAEIESDQAVLRRGGETSQAGTVRINRQLPDQGPFSKILNQLHLGSSVSYGIRLERLQFNPSGVFNWAYVLGATDADFFNAGSGYFLATQPDGPDLGDPLVDTLMFGRYDNTGLGSGSMATGWSNATVLLSTKFETPFFAGGVASIRVDYSPGDDLWSIYANSDASLAPALLGPGDLLSSISDGTLTSLPLPNYGMGFLFSNVGNNDRYLAIESLSVSATPLPASLALVVIGLGGFVLVRVRRRLSGAGFETGGGTSWG
jgi:hypothetical protein